MTVKEFRKIIEDKSESELNAQFFLSILIHHFLGENWYSLYWHQEDINSDAVISILSNYPEPLFKRLKKKFISIYKNRRKL